MATLQLLLPRKVDSTRTVPMLREKGACRSVTVTVIRGHTRNNYCRCAKEACLATLSCTHRIQLTTGWAIFSDAECVEARLYKYIYIYMYVYKHVCSQICACARARQHTYISTTSEPVGPAGAQLQKSCWRMSRTGKPTSRGSTHACTLSSRTISYKHPSVCV